MHCAVYTSNLFRNSPSVCSLLIIMGKRTPLFWPFYSFKHPNVLLKPHQFPLPALSTMGCTKHMGFLHTWNVASPNSDVFEVHHTGLWKPYIWNEQKIPLISFWVHAEMLIVWTIGLSELCCYNLFHWFFSAWLVEKDKSHTWLMRYCYGPRWPL